VCVCVCVCVRVLACVCVCVCVCVYLDPLVVAVHGVEEGQVAKVTGGSGPRGLLRGGGGVFC